MLRTILLLTGNRSLAKDIATSLQRDSLLVINAEGPEDFLNRLDLCQPDMVIIDDQDSSSQIRYPHLMEEYPDIGFLMLGSARSCRPAPLQSENPYLSHFTLDQDVTRLKDHAIRFLDGLPHKHGRSSNEVKSILSARFNEQESGTDIESLFKKLDEAEELSHRPMETLPSLDKANFHFQTLVDAENVASTIAHVCPDPTMASLGLRELMINAIEHGNLGIGHDEKTSLITSGQWESEIERRLELPENEGKFVYVEFQRTNGEVQVKIRDEGKGFDWETYIAEMHIPNKKPHGRGINVATMFAFDTVDFIGCGNEVHVTIKS